MKEFINKYKLPIIIVILIILFLGLSLLMDSNKESNGEVSEDISAWIEDTKGDTPIVTVFAASWCPNCTNHKPVMEALQEEYGFKLYWFEVDLVETENPDDYNALMNEYKIDAYAGRIPFTFIMKNGEYVDSVEGAIGEASVIEFLKNNNVIE